MPFKFNIEGPETKKAREAEMQERALRSRILQMSIEKEDPVARGLAIDQSLQILQDPQSTTGQ